MPGFNIPITDKCGFAERTGGVSNVVETARAHRYSLETCEPFGSKDDGILLYAYKCGRPSVEYDEVEIHNAQDEIFRPGKTHWKPVEFTFYEKLSGNDSYQYNQVARLIYAWHSKTMVDIETGLHNSPSEYLKTAQLDMLDGAETAVWSYYLYDCWPAKCSPSELDYTSTSIAEINVTLRYAKAKEKKPKAPKSTAQTGAPVQSVESTSGRLSPVLAGLAFAASELRGGR